MCSLVSDLLVELQALSDSFRGRASGKYNSKRGSIFHCLAGTLTLVFKMLEITAAVCPQAKGHSRGVNGCAASPSNTSFPLVHVSSVSISSSCHTLTDDGSTLLIRALMAGSKRS